MEQYKIIGGDGREYGPIALEELRLWVRDGRIARDTLIWQETRNLWTPAILLPELRDEVIAVYVRTQPSRMASAPRAGFFPRLGAYLLDYFTLFFLFGLIWPVLVQALGLPDAELPRVESPEELWAALQKFMPQMVVQMAFYLPVYFVYEIGFNLRYGATLGKMAMGLRIICADGSPLNFRTAALRWLVAWLSSAFFFFGHSFILFRTDKRALHDLAAGTQVIHIR